MVPPAWKAELVSMNAAASEAITTSPYGATPDVMSPRRQWTTRVGSDGSDDAISPLAHFRRPQRHGRYRSPGAPAVAKVVFSAQHMRRATQTCRWLKRC